MSTLIDMTGQVYGLLTVIKQAPAIKKETAWLCQCSCGVLKAFKRRDLVKDGRKSCGCGPRGAKLIDLTGVQYGYLTVLKTGERRGPKCKTTWVCKCECGTEKTFLADLLRSVNHPVSCGCGLGLLSLDEQLYSWKKYEAERRNKEWSLTQDEFMVLVLSDCHYCGVQPYQKWKRRKKLMLYQGIDRKDNSIGYTLENSLPCCGHCNAMKLQLSYEDFINKIAQIYSRHPAEPGVPKFYNSPGVS